MMSDLVQHFVDDAVSLMPYPEDTYVTPLDAALPLSSFFPNISFYWRMYLILKLAANIAKRGEYTSDRWMESSIHIREALEKSGVKITIQGLQYLKNLNGPCVVVGNHMSTLETFVLPSILRQFRPVTFVVKESLLRYPVFCHVMRSRDPIVVERKDPRADFSAVMQGGLNNLERGISVIVFPQSTRSANFSRRHFNSMGIKLARKANVPVIPLALRSDAWGMGGLFGLLKDHGAIQPRLPVHLRFGAPITVTGSGKEEHERVLTFIENALTEWGIAPSGELSAGCPADEG